MLSHRLQITITQTPLIYLKGHEKLWPNDEAESHTRHSWQYHDLTSRDKILRIRFYFLTWKCNIVITERTSIHTEDRYRREYSPSLMGVSCWRWGFYPNDVELCLSGAVCQKYAPCCAVVGKQSMMAHQWVSLMQTIPDSHKRTAQILKKRLRWNCLSISSKRMNGWVMKLPTSTKK